MKKILLFLIIVLSFEQFCFAENNTQQQQTKQEQLNIFQGVLDPRHYKVVDCTVEINHISITIEPLYHFSTQYQIKEAADRLVRIMNNTFPGRSITIWLQKNLGSGKVRVYGKGYYDGYTKVITEAY